MINYDSVRLIYPAKTIHSIDGEFKANPTNLRSHKYTKEFKLKVLEACENRGDRSKASVAREFGISGCNLTYFEKTAKNSNENKRLNSVNKKNHLLRLVKEKAALSTTELMLAVGVSRTTIYRWQKEIRGLCND